ncbi:hypothetical protein [Methylovirgula sp. HY1]|jgi:hypothetical protein|uniref:hypothetical protein n=1 Tax=Methylovirgula sp. HY1 TaxID=2822761 RepID=UPI001C5AB10D|nr:hypothetical protein [Methylovirgula sp. HY1]QXX74994.1 hypothetical protein MHY1_01811 [Methylovirgula sp. HY1]
MQLAEAFASSDVDAIKVALEGATVRVYSCPQPEHPDKPIIRNGFLAEFTFAAPAFVGDEPQFVDPKVPAKNVGTPLFVRATKDGTTIGDFSCGPGDSDVKLAEVSCSKDAPVRVTKFQIRPGIGNGVRPVSPTDVMREKTGHQISHEQTYHWNDDFAARKTK